MTEAVLNSTGAYAFPNTPGAIINFKERYDNYIGGRWTPPVNGRIL